LLAASFIEPMLLLRTDRLAEGPAWRYELKLDGYRALAIKSGGSVISRNNNDFTTRYPGLVKALSFSEFIRAPLHRAGDSRCARSWASKSNALGTDSG
jgi:ATP-dependent DNA ligase